MRILWADDQIDVVSTFRSLLAPLNAKITLADSGEQAMDRLSKEYFDLAIVDLMMPPEPWGGLWLLEQMQTAAIRVPVLVLSGEGNQRETIRALRLGARDYVRKDVVEIELLDQIRSLVEADRERAAGYVLDEAPTPVAVPLKRFRAALDPVQKLRRLIEFQEATLRFAALLALAEARASDAARGLNAQQLTIAALLAPSMGTWNHVRTVLMKVLPESGIAAPYGNAFDQRLTSRIIKIRNDLAHTGEPSVRASEELLNEVEVGVGQLIGRLRHLHADLVIPIGMQLKGDSLEVASALLKGDSLALPTANLVAPTPVATNRVYLLRNGEADRDWLDLYPLFVARPAREPSAWEAFVYDGVYGRRGGSGFEGNDALRFADVWSQRRDVELTPHPTADDLRGLTPDWARSDSHQTRRQGG